MTERDHDRESERDWDEHDRDHERERQVAKDTAQRLEREVKETAERLQAGVTTALNAAAETARIHSEAHARDHAAHDRIHAVEKLQVDKAEAGMNERLERMNEFRAALQDAASRMVTRDTLDAYMKDREHRLQAVVDRIIALEKTQVSEDTVSNLRNDQERQRTTMRLAVAGVVLGVAANFIINLLQGAPK